MNNEFTITIFVIKAEDLMPADLNGLADPYVKIPPNQLGITLPKKGLKTNKINDTLNPVWNETLEVTVNTNIARTLKFEVYDHDIIGSDDFLGSADVSLDFLPKLNKGLYEEWLYLTHPEKNKKTKEIEMVQKGRLFINIKINPPFLPGDWIPIKYSKVYIGLGWDFEKKSEVFDLDSSVVGFDEKLNVAGYANYSNLKAFSGAIKHKGDNLTGEGDGDDEVIRVKLDEIPMNILHLSVTINSFKGNSLIKAKSAYIRLFDGKQEYGRYTLARTKDCIGLLLGLFERKEGSKIWFFRVMADPISGHTVKESFEDIRTLIGGYSLNEGQKKMPQHPFQGETLLMPGGWFQVMAPITYVGLGWDFTFGQTFDLDASAICFDALNNVVDIIYHKQLSSKDGSINHLGDNKLGIGDGDDELICINFLKVPQNISTIAIVANSFKGNSLISAKSGFIRIFADNGPIGCHILNQGVDCTGLLLGLFKRGMEMNTWYFQVMIDVIGGIQATESVNDVKVLLGNYMLTNSNIVQN